MTAMHIDKRSFITVDANDGLDLANLLCQTAPASMASGIIYIE
jgi:hypothetical protein